MKHTKYGYQINEIQNNSGTYTWIFTPGGPGWGSEYLIDFAKRLALPGKVLIINFPGDGHNSQGKLHTQDWQQGILDLIQTYEQPILVAHSFSGMFALKLPELEEHLAGLVLLNTTPHNSFASHTSTSREAYHLPDLFPSASAYHLNPNTENYRRFWQDYKYYCFTQQELAAGEKLMASFVFNSQAYLFAIEHYYANYRAEWYPSTIPCLTISGEKDYVCPPLVFIQDPDYNAKNILNVVIKNAGHFVWLNEFEQAKQAFQLYANNKLVSKI